MTEKKMNSSRQRERRIVMMITMITVDTMKSQRRMNEK